MRLAKEAPNSKALVDLGIPIDEAAKIADLGKWEYPEGLLAKLKRLP